MIPPLPEFEPHRLPRVLLLSASSNSRRQTTSRCPVRDKQKEIVSAEGEQRQSAKARQGTASLFRFSSLVKAVSWTPVERKSIDLAGGIVKVINGTIQQWTGPRKHWYGARDRPRIFWRHRAIVIKNIVYSFTCNGRVDGLFFGREEDERLGHQPNAGVSKELVNRRSLSKH